MMRTMSVLVAASALLVLPLAAQQQGGMMGGQMMDMQGMGMMDSMMAPMMRSMATAPERLLLRKAALHLTDDQVSQLTALRDAAKPARDSAAQMAMMHLREMDDVMHTAAPDTAAVRHHFEAALQYMGQAHMAMLDAAAQARAVLTDDQRKQVDAASSMRRRPMMRRGGSMRRP
ncbi:MAG: Spy/CpxP family protein refolding chaperone [Gemmatimonadales bacterium]|jgi:Spy/CpxP family protein refolding chaperone